MCHKDHVLYFLAGAAALHTISHIWLAYSGLLPLVAWGFTVTPQANNIIIAVSALLTLGLLYLAKSDGRGACHCFEKEKPQVTK